MKCRSVSIMRYGMVLTFAVLSCATGCKGTGGWKMPSMFGSREPDAGKLAGTTTPPSPAEKYTPSAIASKTPSSATPSNQPGSLPYGGSSTASYTSTAPKGGLAAQANGYQTGPYTTNTSTTSPSGTTSLASSTTSTNSASGSQGFASPYGGTYNGVSAGTTNVPNLTPSSGQLPTNSLANSTPTQSFSPPSTSMPGYGTPAAPANQTAAAGISPVYPPNQSPAVYGSISLPNEQPSYSMPAIPNINGGLPTATAVATASPSAQPAVSAYQSTPTAGTYAPGSTGRSNPYNFGTTSQVSQPAQNMSPPHQSLPPNTASGDNLLIR